MSIYAEPVGYQGSRVPRLLDKTNAPLRGCSSSDHSPPTPVGSDPQVVTGRDGSHLLSTGGVVGGVYLLFEG